MENLTRAQKCDPWQIMEKAKAYFGSGHRKTYPIERHGKPSVDLTFNSGFSSPVIVKARQTWF